MIDKMGDRLKQLEGIEAGRILIPNLPICVRVDGRAFHTFTRGMKRPYDIDMSNAMIETMKYLVEKTDACLGYVQSDEISLILSDRKEPMFGGRIQKLTSVIASMATAKFNEVIHKTFPDKPLAEFDCRVWNVPRPHTHYSSKTRVETMSFFPMILASCSTTRHSIGQRQVS